MTNPLLQPWDGPFGLPDFSAIRDEDFAPAFEAGIAAQEEEFEAIASNPEPATFENTVEALERHGLLLDRVAAIFFNRSGGDTNETIQAAERDVMPKLSQLWARHNSDPRVFSRLQALVDAADPAMTPEQARVLKLMHESFVRAGAELDDAGKARMQEIMGRLSELGTAFGQNVLKDEADWSMSLTDDDLEGLPAFLIDSAKAEAVRREQGGYVITLSRSSVEPFLTFSARRDLREKAFRGWADRGEETNWPLIEETVKLRAERAQLLGFDSFADYKLDNQMAKTPDGVRELLMAVWEPAKARAEEETSALKALAAEEGAEVDLAPWDWRYYAEKLRKREHDLDEAEIKPYLKLENVIEASFDVAGRLFGLSFQKVDAQVPHPDAMAFEVNRGDEHVGLFIGDYFARPSKRSGAWMSGFRSQQRLWDPQRPVITNTCNFAKGDPTLLSWDDARTVFHEFGHALHGLLSNVTYPYVSGTSVARDFVELPSQLYEHWFVVPEILEKHARHYQTGAPMPRELVDRVIGAENFNQGFKTVEYTASALVDLEMHVIENADNFDGAAFEADVLERIGMPKAIIMRHRSPHFQHVFSGDGYSAGYYSYMWSEVMDADAFKAFEETGDVFDEATAKRLGGQIYSVGGSVPPEDAYIAFRDRLPGVEALLEGRGLTDVAAG
ncbi:MAG: M3 family metallopeptidase [Pseudomonadota bacterium]